VVYHCHGLSFAAPTSEIEPPLSHSLAIGKVKTGVIAVQIIKTQLMQTYLNVQCSLKCQLLTVKSFAS